MKRLILNLALLVVVLGLGVLIWWDRDREEPGPPLTPLKAEQVTRIVLEHPGQAPVRLEKHDGAWRLTAPVQAATDGFEVNGILALADQELKATLDAGVDVKALELEPAKYRVTLNDVAIDVGGSEPIKFRRYVRSGGVIGLIEDPPSAALDADFSDLVSKSVVPQGVSLRRLELPGLVLEKNAEGAWSSPQQGSASTAQLAQLVESWKNAKAMWNAPMEAGDEQAGEAFTLVLDDGRSLALRVLARDPQLVLANPAARVRYTLSKALADELFKIPAPPSASAPAGAPPPP